MRIASTAPDGEKFLGSTKLLSKPFLKWAGGKRWLTRYYADLFPTNFDRYFEPFLGSGAIYFSLLPENATLSDSNPSLVNCYCTVRSFPNLVHERLKQLHEAHSKRLYYEIRSSNPISDVDRAVHFIYLNRVCWNGLYRVNLRGQFNVPIGTKTSVVFSDDDFVEVSRLLETAQIFSSDFETTILRSRRNDFVYVDPPYTVKHNNNGFLKYNENIFSWDDQVRLRKVLDVASRRGVKVAVSNANHPSVIELYDGFGNATVVYRQSVISGKLSGRAHASELLIRNFQ